MKVLALMIFLSLLGWSLGWAGESSRRSSPGSSLNVCPTREQLCPTPGEKKAKDLPAISHSISVRYCDKPVVVWVILKDGKLARFDATNTPSSKDFPKIEDFMKWLDAAPNDVYDLPCVGEKAQKGLEIPHDEGEGK